MSKADMSRTCEFKDRYLWFQKERNEVTQEEFDEWFSNNCNKCIYANEICMYGED